MKSAANFSLQAVAEQDLLALFALRTLAMQESLARLQGLHGSAPDERRVQQAFLAATRWQDLTHIVQDGLICGFIGWHAEAADLRLQHFYLDPQHQGRGLGSAVLLQLCQHADKQQQALKVAVLRESRAHAFYLRFAFQPCAASAWDIDYVRKPQIIESYEKEECHSPSK